MTETDKTQAERTIRASRSEYSEICLPNDANMLGNMWAATSCTWWIYAAQSPPSGTHDALSSPPP